MTSGFIANTNTKAPMALKSLILGILSVATSFALIGALFGFAGSVLGVIHFFRSTAARNIAIWGFLLSLLGLFASGVFAFLYIQRLKP